MCGQLNLTLLPIEVGSLAGPGLRLVAPRGGAQTGQVLLTIYWNPVLIRYDY